MCVGRVDQLWDGLGTSSLDVSMKCADICESALKIVSRQDQTTRRIWREPLRPLPVVRRQEVRVFKVDEIGSASRAARRSQAAGFRVRSGAALLESRQVTINGCASDSHLELQR